MSKLKENIKKLHKEGILDKIFSAMEREIKKLSDKEKCEIAFMKTNSIDNGWWHNEEVTKMFDGEACRSTSSGDIVLIGNKKYKCAPVGWELC